MTKISPHFWYTDNWPCGTKGSILLRVVLNAVRRHIERGNGLIGHCNDFISVRVAKSERFMGRSSLLDAQPMDSCDKRWHTATAH